ncbi:SNF1-related protein [Drosera capensis]
MGSAHGKKHSTAAAAAAGNDDPTATARPEFPGTPLPISVGSRFPSRKWNDESHASLDSPSDKGIPTLITWTQGGNNVAVEGSWDNWTSRRFLHKSGKDHSLLLVLPSGIYHCKFIADGEYRYMPDLPCASVDTDQVCNVLAVHDHVPECLDSAAEFEAPESPDSSYGQSFPREDEFAKEPAIVPPQVEFTVLGTSRSGIMPFTHPQHVVLNHVFEDKAWRSQSIVGLGLTHRFQSKYVTVVLYKPLDR